MTRTNPAIVGDGKPDRNALFGGCFVKSHDARGMGYLGDADLSEWRAALQRTSERFPKIRKWPCNPWPASIARWRPAKASVRSMPRSVESVPEIASACRMAPTTA